MCCIYDVTVVCYLYHNIVNYECLLPVFWFLFLFHWNYTNTKLRSLISCCGIYSCSVVPCKSLLVYFNEAERLQEVQVYIGKTRDSYKLAAYQPGLVGSILTLQTSTNNCGQWLMITRKIPHEHLTLCEVQVMGHPLEGIYVKLGRLSTQN